MVAVEGRVGQKVISQPVTDVWLHGQNFDLRLSLPLHLS